VGNHILQINKTLVLDSQDFSSYANGERKGKTMNDKWDERIAESMGHSQMFRPDFDRDPKGLTDMGYGKEQWLIASDQIKQRLIDGDIDSIEGASMLHNLGYTAEDAAEFIQETLSETTPIE